MTPQVYPKMSKVDAKEERQMFKRLINWLTYDPLEEFAKRYYRHQEVIKSLVEDIQDQAESLQRKDEIIKKQQDTIDNLRKQTKDYYDLLFAGCELRKTE